ncbi:MAG: SBBP repeat-containing protein [Clostridia bacterium]|nr:SBBP repeat-containing protein [Clostridia bacterium]
MSINIKDRRLKDSIRMDFINNPPTFIPNRGQVDSKVKYYLKGTSYGFYFTPEEAVLTFIKKESSPENTENTGITLALHFVDANPDVKIEGINKASAKINYFNGKDESKWITGLPTYEKIIYKELWSGIDLIFYSKNNVLKYDFILKPGGCVEDIKLSYRGSKGISVDDGGNLEIHNDLGVLIDEKPISYQEIESKKVMIESGFKIKRQEDGEDYFGFAILGNYDSKYSLVIDPGLVFSTFLGAIVIDVGTNESNKLGITVDKAGNVYVAGGTISPSFPVTLGAFQEVFPSVGDNFTSAYVTKLSFDGSGLIYSTFLGGSDSDEARSIVIDNMGSAYITGETSSSDFPVTLGAFQENNLSMNGEPSAFAAKLSPDGTQLIYSTFLGGSDDDEGTDIDIDIRGNAYITGETDSPDFPVTSNAFQQNLPSIVEGPNSVFVTKLNIDGSSLIYSTFLGGSGNDEGLGIAVDDMGSAYVTGNTSSPDFPVTLGAFQENFSIIIPNLSSAFVTKLNPDGSSLIYSTFLGGSVDDQGQRIAVDQMGNAYVGGEAASPDFPVTLGAFQEEFIANQDAGFVTKLNSDGSQLIYSTFLSGTGGDNEVQGIAVDKMGNAYVSGFSNSSSFPTTLGAFQEEFQGIANQGFGDAFVAKINPDGSSLIYSTFLGGSQTDIARDIAIDQEGNAYVVGYTISPNFPVTLGAFEENFKGDTDNDGLFDTFVAKITPTPTS